MRCLVIGCGYLGRRVARRWRERGGRVLATTRTVQHADELRAEGIEPVLCDVLRPDALRELPAMDVVLYAVGWDRSSGVAMRQVYVDGLEAVLRSLAPPGKFIQVSSTSVYGQTDGNWVDEESPTAPEEESGRIVLEAEQVLRRHIQDAVILRFAGIYGPGRLLRQKAIEAGEAISGDENKWLNLIHVEDGADAIAAAAQRAPAAWLCNVCDGHPVTRRDFFAELAKLLNAPPPRFAARAPGGPAPPHEKAHRRISNRRLCETLGFTPAHGDYRAGLRVSVSSGVSSGR